MVDPAINHFFAERKEVWLKKNITAGMEDWEKLEKQQECEHIFALKNWLPNAASRAGQISISTHPCTFSHPSARKNKNGYATSIIAQNRGKTDGYFRTGNIETEPDALGNAAALDVYKFLTLPMPDNRNLLQHIEKESDLAKALLSQEGSDYQTLRSGFLKMIETDHTTISSSKIKQVYFPVDDGEYHLLSILTHSGHLFELRKRIDHIRFSEESKLARECKKKGQYHPNGYREIYGITTIGFGGTKPQNISVLNNQNGGKAHLLPSVPPTLKPRNLRLPKTDFFKETFTPWQAKEVLHALHDLIKLETNNINSRNKRDAYIQEYVDLIIQKMWQVRLFLKEHQGKLSGDLNSVQQIWLYPEHEQQRQEDDEWLETLMRQIARSLINHYPKVVKVALNLRGDKELLNIENIVKLNKEALR